MIITTIGEGAFRLQSGERAILIDPANNRQKGDITLVTSSKTDRVEGDPSDVRLPGEYEFGGIEVRGWQRGFTNGTVQTYYLVIWDDIGIAFIGAEGPLPDPSSLEELERFQPEVVLLPMKTKEQAEWSAALVKQLEPSVVIPSVYDNVKTIAQAFGTATPAPEEKFTFKKKDLAGHDQALIILTNRNA